MKEIATQIEDMLLNGYDVEDIAVILDYNVDEVKKFAESKGYKESVLNYGEFDE